MLLGRGAPFAPVLLVVVRGGERGKGTPRRQRAPQCCLVSVPAEEAWALAGPRPALVAWAGQRWAVEVMHRALKRGCGLGEQPAGGERGGRRPCSRGWSGPPRG